jgi:MFS family permease
MFFVPSHPTKNAANSSEAARSPTLDQQQHAQPLQPQDKQQQLRLRQQQQVATAPGHEQQQQQAAATAKVAQQQQQQPQQGFWDSVVQFWRDVRSMGVDFYRTLSVIALYGLGHINESLLEARAIEVGFGKAESTLVVALLCFSVFLCAYPMGRLDDKHGHATTFALGMASLVAGDLVLLLSGQWPAAVFVACGFWGVHWAVVQGPMLSAVVGMAPPHLKGTAFGIFYTMMAVVAVIANTMFGSIWHAHSATAAFALSALLITVTMVLTPFLLPASAKVGRRKPGAASSSGSGGDAGSGSGGVALKPAAA